MHKRQQDKKQKNRTAIVRNGHWQRQMTEYICDTQAQLQGQYQH